jgi:hypothetical protein
MAMVRVTIVANGVLGKVRAISMNIPSRWLRRGNRLLVRFAGLGVAFVLALVLGAGIAFVTQGSLSVPRGAEPQPADATTTSIEEEDTDGGHNIGVWYDAQVRRWAIFNQDLASMAQGTSFDVHVLSEGGRRSSTRPPPRTPPRTAPT